MSLKNTTASDSFILENYPYPLANFYQSILSVDSVSERVLLKINFFEHVVRALALVIVSNYIQPRDPEIVDKKYHELLYQKLPTPSSLGTWLDLLFSGIRAFENHRDDFFIPELYDLHLDGETKSHFQELCMQLAELRNENIHSHSPSIEAEWEALETIVLDKLEHVFEHLKFIEKYNLVLLKNRYGKVLTFDVWRGVEIFSKEITFDNPEKLVKGQFYITQSFEKFLLLHPFLISDDMLIDDPPGDNVGTYEKFSKADVIYMALPQQIETRSSFLHTTINGIYLALLQYGKTIINYDAIEWVNIIEVIEKINKIKANQSYHEFNNNKLHELFIQREFVSQYLNDFLKTDKRLFVILGKSGVGKSSFLADTALRYQDNKQFSMLIYDAAKFKSDTRIIAELTQDFNTYLSIEGVDTFDEKKILSLLEDVAKRSNTKIILAIDAINESENPVEILKQLDELATKQHTDWLKIIVTCRPQSWRDIRQSIRRLSDHLYYTSEVSDDIGITLSEFNEMEVIQAFERYKKLYSVLSNYNSLSVFWKRTLMDPLMMALTMSAYRGKNLPSIIRPSQLYSQYIDNLMDSYNKGKARLRHEDIWFLEKDLMPLFIQNINYEGINNQLKINDLYNIRTENGIRLVELILAEDELSSGRPLNLPFQNLSNAEILTLRGSPIDLELGFRYERFWEYFGAKRLDTLLDKEKILDQYIILAEIAHQKSYVLGVLRSSVLNFIEKHYETEVHFVQMIIYKLCDNTTTVDIAEQVLHTIGQEKIFPLNNLLQILLQDLPDSSASDSAQSFSRKQVAIMIAAKFGYDDILREALNHRSPDIRALSIIGFYRYWQNDNEQGFKLLEDLTNQCFNWIGIPRLRYFESTLGCSLYILFQHFDESPVTTRLLAIWKPLLATMLRYRSGEKSRLGRIFETVKSVFRQQIINSVIKMIVRWGKNTTSGENGLSIPELTGFFINTENLAERKQLATYMIAFFNKEKYDIADIEPYLMQAAKSRYILICWLSIIVLEIHFDKSPKKTMELIEKLFEEAGKLEPVGPLYGYTVPWLLSMILHPKFNPNAKEYFERAEIISRIIFARTRGRYTAQTTEILMPYFLPSVYAEAKGVIASTLSEEVKQSIARIKQDHDTPLIKRILGECAPAGIHDFMINYGLLVLEQFLDYKNSDNQDVELEIRNYCIEILQKIRIKYRDKVDNFLMRVDVDSEFIQEVISKSPKVKVSDEWSAEGLLFWEDAIIRNQSKDFHRKLHWFFHKISETKTLEEWLSFLLKGVINLIYEENIFPQVQKDIDDFIQKEYLANHD